MKKLFFFLSLLVSLTTFGQVYNPAQHTVTNKSYGMGQAGPTDARSYFFDSDNFRYRAYLDTGEVKTYLSLPKYRTGQFDIVVNTGGTLGIDGIISGGTNAIWYFKDSTGDDYLVPKIVTAETLRFGVEDNVATQVRSFDAADHYVSIFGTVNDGLGTLRVTNDNDFAITGNSTNGYAISGTSTHGVGVNAASDDGTALNVSSGGLPAVIGQITASTSTVQEMIRVAPLTSGAAASGFGGSIDWRMTRAAGGGAISNQLISSWTDPGETTYTSEFALYGALNGALTRKLAVAGTGQLTLNDYGQGTFAGVVAKVAAFSSAGAMIEVDASSIGGGIRSVDFANGLTARNDSTGILGGTADQNTTNIWGAFTWGHSFNSITGDGLTIGSTSTAVSGSADLLQVDFSGANSGSSIATRAFSASNVRTGTTATNIGILGTASGAASSNVGVQGIANVSTGIGVQGATTSGVAVYGQASSSGVGVESSSSSGTALFSFSGTGLGADIQTSNTATTATPVNVAKFTVQSSGTPTAGFGGYLSLAAENATQNREVARLGWDWTDVTDASRTGGLFVKTTNSGTTTERFRIAGTGQITESAYGAGTYTGSLAKLAGWTSAGVRIEVDPSSIVSATPSWLNTINVDRTNSGLLIFDSSMAKPTGIGDPATKTWMQFEPLVSADDSVNAPFYWNQGGFLNNNKTNEVMSWGWNVSPGAGQVQAGKPGLGESWEQNYQTDASGYGSRLVEKHEIYLKPTGEQIRLGSYTINTNANTIRHYHSVDNFDYRSPTENLPYFGGAGVADNSAINLSNISTDGETFSITGDFEQDATTASLTFGQGSGKTNNEFNTSGFNVAKLPGSTTFTPLTGDAANIGLRKSDGTLTYSLSNNGTITTSNSVLGNLQLAASNLTVAELRSNVINNYVNTTIGPQTSAIARLDVQNSAENITSYFDNTKGSGTKYAGIFSTTGAGTSNRGINITASGATENIGIRIDAPAAGANNWSIYSLGTAKSYFAGLIQTDSKFQAINSPVGSATSDSVSKINRSTGDIEQVPLDADLITWAGVTPGTGVATALGVNIGSAGAPVLFNGAGGTPSSLTLTNATGLPQSGVTSLTSDLALKAPLASPTFTGTPTLPTGTIGTTQSAGNSTTALATTAFVTTADNLKANLASPALTGSPTAPTQTADDNSTKIATTAYVDTKPADNVSLLRALGSTVLEEASCGPMQGISGSTGLTDAQQYIEAIYLKKAQTITGVKFRLVTSGVFTGDAENSVALYSYSGGVITRVAISSNDPNIWKQSSAGFVTAAFTGTYPAAAGVYYIGVLYNQSAQSTQPAIANTPGSTSAAVTGDFTNSAKLVGTLGSQTSQGTPLNLSSFSANGTRYYLALY